MKYLSQKKSKSHILESKLLFIIGFIFLVAIGTLYIYNTWNYYYEKMENNAMGCATTAASFLSADMISKLEINFNDLEKAEYQLIKNNLRDFKSRNNNIRFAYLYTQVDGKIYYMVDSETPDSAGYSPPGKEYKEATNRDMQPFMEGKPILAEPINDRWGIWASALVPVKHPRTGEVMAVFGVDFTAEDWKAEVAKHVVHVTGVVLCILLLLIALYSIMRKNIALKSLGSKLEDSEELFRIVFEQAPIGIAVVKDYYNVTQMNKTFEKILGRTKKEIIALNWREVTHSDDLNEDLEQFGKFTSGEIDAYSVEKRYIMPDGSYTWVNVTIAGLKGNGTNNHAHVCIIRDINQRKNAEKALQESERSKSVLISHLPGMAYRCSYDGEWNMQFVSEGCFNLTGYEPEKLLNNKEVSYHDLIPIKYRDIRCHEWERVLALQISFRYEYEIISATGERKWVLEMGQGIYDETDNAKALEGIIIDITEQKAREAQIQYMNDHDYLTGLYNRKYFEEAMHKMDREDCLPLAIIIADINGVRLINDAFGYAEGDQLIKESSKILQICCRPGDVLARIGGDEFSILLPNTDSEAAYEMLNVIKRACGTYNEKNKNSFYEISLSMGYATKESGEESIGEVAKTADEYLRNRKLLNRKSFHNNIISSMMAAVYEKSQETEKHAKRIAALSKKIGEKLILSRRSLSELELLAMLHDIGKVGIYDQVLNKPGKLDEDEWNVMKKHPEIGYRIAKSSSELEHIAEYILTHHERWDGKGYPQGLKGEGIPLLSRILAVADAFDAMTEDRIYRKAMTWEGAIEEIRKNAGTQFNPQIAQIFIEIIKGDKNINIS